MTTKTNKSAKILGKFSFSFRICQDFRGQTG